MLVDKLVEECTENIEETRLVETTWVELHSAKNENNHKCSSSTLYIELFSIIFTINVGIRSYFLYFNWCLKLVLKQQFNEPINGKSQTNRNQKSNLFFFNGIINIQEIDLNLLKIGKKSYKDTYIYYVGYIAIKKNDDCENIYSANPLFLITGKVDRHIEEKNGRKI